jgi:peptidoglycan glycosyltransferase
MNRPIVRLYVLVVLMFALLVAFTSRWTVFEASSLRSNPLNKRTLLEQQQIDRGRILAADGTVPAPRVALQARGEHHGAVVALEPSTGAVKVMASSPSYDPNTAGTADGYARLARQTVAKPLVNRATQFGYAPGSTFKVVTATAAIDSGEFTPESTLSGRNEIPISGVALKNDNNESFGQITLRQALAKSVNTVWAQVAVKLGKATLARYMSRFGFDRKPELA